MVSDRRRAHRQAMVWGIGASTAAHAALLGWASFTAPPPDTTVAPMSPDRPPAASSAVQVIRLPELRVTASREAPDADASAPSASQPTREPAVDAGASGGRGTEPTDPGGARPATDPGPPPGAASAELTITRRQARLEDPLVASAGPIAVGDVAPSARLQPPQEGQSRHDGNAGAGEREDEDGGWGLGDLFGGVSVSISGGGTCLPDLLPGRTTGVRSVNDRSPVGIPGVVGNLGGIGRIGGLRR